MHHDGSVAMTVDWLMRDGLPMIPPVRQQWRLLSGTDSYGGILCRHRGRVKARPRANMDRDPLCALFVPFPGHRSVIPRLCCHLGSPVEAHGVCPVSSRNGKDLCVSPCRFSWWALEDSNLRPTDYESVGHFPAPTCCTMCCTSLWPLPEAPVAHGLERAGRAGGVSCCSGALLSVAGRSDSWVASMSLEPVDLLVAVVTRHKLRVVPSTNRG